MSLEENHYNNEQKKFLLKNIFQYYNFFSGLFIIEKLLLFTKRLNIVGRFDKFKKFLLFLLLLFFIFFIKKSHFNFY